MINLKLGMVPYIHAKYLTWFFFPPATIPLVKNELYPKVSVKQS